MVSMDKKQPASYRGPDLKLFVRDVSDRQGKKRPISVRSWSTIKDVKDTIQKTLNVPVSAQRLYFGPLLARELPNHRTLHDAGIYRSGETLLLDIRGSPDCTSSPFSSIYSLRSSSASDICISSSVVNNTPKALRSIATEARRGFALGIKPELGLDGSGGTYFLHDARKNKIAVFKPADEEPYAENNPRGYLRQAGGPPMSMRDGIAPGEACIREVAAFLLDHEGVSGVPMTTLCEARHPAFNTNGARLKVAEGGAAIGSHSISLNGCSSTMKKAGSFQEFVRSEGTMDDISPSKIDDEEVHKIAILDIRIMNADRNSANLLVRRAPNNSLKLVPIDHGYCLRTASDVSWMDWCWLDWPQMKKPISDKLKQYVLEQDIESDARLLSEQLNIPEEAIDIFRASSSLLKAGVRAGLTLYDIAVLCCRNDNLAEVPSVLEKLVDMAADLAQVAIDNERWHHVAASRALVEQLSPDPNRVKRRCSAFSRMSSYDSESFPQAGATNDFENYRRESESVTTSLLREALEQGARDSPAMAQSSASDSSSETGDGTPDIPEKDECEVWAAGVILDVSHDPINIPQRGRSMRSDSFISDDGYSDDSGLSCSPRGFWHIRPGSSMNNSETDSVNWSPQMSPRNSPSPLPRTSATFATPDSLPTPLNIGVPAVDYKRPSITFAPGVGGAPGPFLAPPSLPTTVNVSKPKDNPETKLVAPIPRRMDSGLSSASATFSRSKSYAALSNASTCSGSVAPSPLLPKKKSIAAEDYETFRKYFHKFIDLVIVRETTAAFHNAAARNY